MQTKLYHFFLLALAVLLCHPGSTQVVINEYSCSNLSGFGDNYGKFEDWVELYNSSGETADISGFGLSDNIENPFRWTFPEGTTIDAYDFIRVWTSGRNETSSGSHMHTNFRLTQTKDEQEYVVLSDLSGGTTDIIPLEITQKEHSRGRATDGADEWGVFINPTCGWSNDGATAYQRYATKPIASIPAGFYDDGMLVSLTTEELNAQIHFTTDGSKPTSASQVYSTPISVSSTTIVKAITVSANSNILPGFIEFNTYFIDESHTLAVMSVSAEELDDLLNGNQWLRPFGTFEYFNAEGVRTTFGYGEFNKHGQDSWVHDQRSIDYITRDECGYNYAIREQMIPITDRDEFQRVIMRAAGDDNYPGIDTSAHLRDYYVQNISEKGGLHLDVRKGQKGIMYVNGDYWGIYGYREKVDDHDFTDYYYDQDKYNIFFLKLWGSSWAEYGGQAAFDDWNELHDFIKSQDMADPENWGYVKSRYDYKSLVDYVHINSYVVCSDWINWNVGWWRGLNPTGGHRKWGYILWDEDATFAHYINYTGVPGISPYTTPCFPEGLTSDPEEHIVALNELRENPEFEQYYVSRYIDLYNTVFRPDRMISYLDSIEAEMDPEIPKHVERWGGSYQEWRQNVTKIKNFIQNRHEYLAENGFGDCWDLEGPWNLEVTVEPEQTGGVKFNSLELSQFPFTGSYFGNIDIKLEARELNSNYEFDYWELNNHAVFPNDSVKFVTLQLTSGDQLVAHFKERLYVDSLVINEINYNASDDFDTEDWVEFYNPHLYDLDITSWYFKDNDDEHVFTFPENTTVESDGYLVLCRNMEAFTDHFPDVENVYGDMDFGMSGNGELIRLFNDEGILIDTVHYGVDLPWPPEPDGNGPTLELILPHYDNALAGSWMASPEHGTPGMMNSYWVGLPENDDRRSVARMSIAPNPTASNALVTISGKDVSYGTLIIYNSFGNVVRKIEDIPSKQFVIRKQNLEPGLYLIQFSDAGSDIILTQKLIIK